MKPATKERLHAWLVAFIIVGLLDGFFHLACAQSKPDTVKVKPPETVTLSMDKLKSRFEDLQKAREKAVKQRDDADNAIKAIDGALQALQMVATDSTLQAIKPKK